MIDFGSIVDNINNTNLNFCLFHILYMVTSMFYGLLFISCWRLIRKHALYISSGQATGLSCYLISSALFCIYRMISLIIMISLDEECSYIYNSDSYYDIQDLLNHQMKGWKYAEFILSILSISFYYTSYSYFAYSLTKVLDLLTSSDFDPKLVRLNSSFLNIFIGIIISLWISVVLIWITSLIQNKSIRFMYILARTSLCIASLVISMFLSLYCIKGLIFIRR